MDQGQFARTRLSELFTVKQIVTLHDFEFSKDFIFEGEKHDFWEIVYVDKGEMDVLADTERIRLKQGDLIFHKPNEFHGVFANRRVAPNVSIVTFVCHSEDMSYFEQKIFRLDAEQREIFAQVIKNGFLAFDAPFDNPWKHTLKRRIDAPPGTEQLIRIYLELLLIRLHQTGALTQHKSEPTGVTKERSDKHMAKLMTDFMEQHLEQDMRLEHICKHFNISKNHALTMFKERTGLSVMKYYRRLKMEKAKQMIREEHDNFSEIAGRLHYSNVHNFSRTFKSLTGMSPSEYARSIKAKM